jgi:hypothetical protein
MTKYYSDDEFGHEEVETRNENKITDKHNIDYMDVNILLDKLDDIVQDYSNEEYELACIGPSDYLFKSNFKVNFKHNKNIYEMSENLYHVIKENIGMLSEEDSEMFEDLSINLIYSRIMKCINFRYV